MKINALVVDPRNPGVVDAGTTRLVNTTGAAEPARPS